MDEEKNLVDREETADAEDDQKVLNSQNHWEILIPHPHFPKNCVYHIMSVMRFEYCSMNI